MYKERGLAIVKCLMCGIKFRGRKRRKFCSKSCSNTYTNLFGKEYWGESNSNWKGGIAKSSNSRYLRMHPGVNRAKAAVLRATRDGRLKKEPCQVCMSANSEAHHQGYNKPLTVDWRCHRCHSLIHASVRALCKVAV